MLRWLFFLGVGLIAVGCSLIGGERDECEIPHADLVSKIEGGLTIEGASLKNPRASRSVAYENMWFLAARIDAPGFEDDPRVVIWGVDDLRNPELIWWANDRAREVSNWGDEMYFSSSTDGIGRSRFCSDRADDS